MALRVGALKGSVEKIIKDHLDVRKINARWIPKELTAYQKKERVRLSEEFWAKFKRNWNCFKNRIITSDESWVLYDNPLPKNQIAEWCFSGEKIPEVAKIQNDCRKVMLTVFWDRKGVIMTDYLPKKVKMDSKYYCNMLENLQSKISSARPEIAGKKLRLLIDNAPCHKSALTSETLSNSGFTLIDHPPYSTDLTPSDYHLFKFLKNFLQAKNSTPNRRLNRK